MNKKILRFLLVLMFSLSFMSCSTRDKSRPGHAPKQVKQTEVSTSQDKPMEINTLTENNSTKNYKEDLFQQLLTHIRNNDNNNAEIILAKLLDNPESRYTRFIFDDLTDFISELLQRENKSDLIEKLYKSGFNLALDDQNNIILFRVLGSIIRAAFINYTNTSGVQEQDYKDNFYIKTDALNAILKASQEIQKELSNALKLNQDFSFYEKNISDEINIKARYYRTSYISFMNYYLTPFWWTSNASGVLPRMESRLATFFRQLSIVQTLTNLEKYKDTFSFDSMKNIYVYGNSASRKLLRKLLKDKIGSIHSASYGSNSSKQEHENVCPEIKWLDSVESIGLFYHGGFSNEYEMTKYMQDYFPATVLDRGDRVSYKNNPCFKELTYFIEKNIAVDIDGDCMEDRVDFDIDEDGTANALDSHPFNNNITFEDVDNDQIPDHLDWDVNNKIVNGHNIEDATFQKKIFNLTGYLVQDGSSKFSSKELYEIYNFFERYQFTQSLNDSLISVVKMKNVGIDTNHGSYLIGHRTLVLYDNLFKDKTDEENEESNQYVHKECMGIEIPKLQLYQTLIHEFAHVIEAHDDMLSIKDPTYKSKIRLFLQNAGWFFYPNPSFLGWGSVILFEDFNDSIISYYGQKNAREYFAELFSAAVLLSKPWIENNYEITADDICFNLKAFTPNLFNYRNFKPEDNNNDNNIYNNLYKPLLEIIDLVEHDTEWGKPVHLDYKQRKRLVIPFLDSYNNIYDFHN